MAYIIIAITFITALTTVQFSNFWQALTVQSFISACFGALLGEAFLKQVFKITMRKNEMLLGAHLDKVNPLTSHIPLDALFEKLQQHAMIVSMKEIYGWLCLLGIFCLMAFLLNESSLRPKSLHPKFSTLRRTMKHELKIDKLTMDD